MVAVAAVLDARVNRRVCKDAWTVQAALQELERMAAQGQLDAQCVAQLRPNPPAGREMLGRIADDAGGQGG
jgi:HD-GYP domain-containing protein (c-di-GMP phosphodiesterase class II)